MKTPSTRQHSFDKTVFNPIFLQEVFIVDETDTTNEEDFFDDFEEVESTINPNGFNAFKDSEHREFEII